MGIVAFRHFFGGHRRIAAGDHGDFIAQLVEETAALADGLLMGVNGADIFHFRAGFGQQFVADKQLGTADDITLMALEQFVNAAHRAVGAVFDGENAVFAESAVHGLKNGVEAFYMGHIAPGNHLFRGDLRIGAFHALTGHGAAFGKDIAAVL